MPFIHPPKLPAIATLAAFATTIAASSARADDSAWLQNQLQKCYTGTGPCALNLGGTRRTFAHPVTIAPNLVTIRDLTVTCTMSSGTCLNVTMDGFESLQQWNGAHSLENVTLIGNGRNDGITMSYNGKNPSIDAVIGLDHVRITGFNRGIVLGSGTWGGVYQDMQLGNNHTGIYVQPNVWNAGERSTFSGTIYNSTIGIDEESNYEFDFTGVSFDFNQTQMILNGPTNFTGHIENGTGNTPVILLNALPGVTAGSLYMSAGSTITVDGYNKGHPSAPCYIKTVVPWNNIQVPATSWGFAGSSGSPVCGPGTTYSFGTKVPAASLSY